MICQWLDNLEFEWAEELPFVYDDLLGFIFWFIVYPIGVILDILLFPIEIIIWFIRRKGDKE